MNQRRKEIKQGFTVVGESSAPSIESVIVSQQPDIPISFDNWWLQTQSKYKFKSELKMAVQKHFEARGFTDYKKFNDGLRDFGYGI